MELETPLKEGFLLCLPQGVALKKAKKKSWQKKYCMLFKSSKFGIQRLEVFDSEEESAKNCSSKILALENCVKISPAPQPHQMFCFMIVTRTDTHHMATLFDIEMKEWISELQAVAFQGCHLLKDEDLKEYIEEDNDLYCSFGDGGKFSVRVVPSAASKRCQLKEDVNYTLNVTHGALELRSPAEERLLFSWPFKYIRRYGYRGGHFTFEAGRKCDSGEGVFQLENKQQQEIFRVISKNMKEWRKSMNGEENSSSSSPPPCTPPAITTSRLICGDSQYNAALSMEAGSRSPLPPSPTATTVTSGGGGGRFIDLCGLDNVVKVIPSKPPRTKAVLVEHLKNVIDPSLLKKFSSEVNILAGSPPLTSPYLASENNSFSYETVEVRKEAWRTLGTDEPSHTENEPRDSDEEVLTSIKKRPCDVFADEKLRMPKPLMQLFAKVVASRKIIPQVPPSPCEEYDKLQHFGNPHTVKSSSSVAVTSGGIGSGSMNKSKYRQIQHALPAGANNTSPSVVPSPPSVSTPRVQPSEEPVAWNEYDTIQFLELPPVACRPADDSHQGYGMIRKTVPQNVDTEYAMVVKPKKF